jgi:hypothetical protein
MQHLPLKRLAGSVVTLAAGSIQHWQWNDATHSYLMMTNSERGYFFSPRKVEGLEKLVISPLLFALPALQPFEQGGLADAGAKAGMGDIAAFFKVPDDARLDLRRELGAPPKRTPTTSMRAA